MTTDEYSGVIANANVDLGNFRAAIGCGIGFIQKGHHINAIFSGFKHQPDKLVYRQAVICYRCKPFNHKSENTWIIIA
ncbi:hypothetical protein SDC9_157351 [bioreactor metagenome]|uniref:Uncharacterized protein n=1 Tax=bioreactor metagenome TaxID=1076179 RepID=A0A645F6Q8_9ZZZZ